MRDAVVVDSLLQVITRREEISLITDGRRNMMLVIWLMAWDIAGRRKNVGLWCARG